MFASPRRVACALLALACLVAPQHAAGGNTEPAARLVAPVLKTTKLANGITAWVEEDHRVPVVAIDIRFDIGHADDPPGRRGMAALAAEILELGQTPRFEGSYRGDLATALGGALQSPSVDVDVSWTELRFLVPANSLELALFSESDRIGFLSDGLTAARLSSAVSRVANGAPQADAWRVVLARLREALYGSDQRYGRMVPGDGSELKSATVDEVRQWLRDRYLPASISIVGDVSKDKALELVNKYFGAFRARQERTPDPAPSVMPGQKKIVVEANIQRSGLAVGWPTAKLFDDDDLALDIAARVLTNRLRERLVDRERNATWVSAGQSSLSAASVFNLQICLESQSREDEVLKAIDEEVARLKAEKPSAEEVASARSNILANHADARDGVIERAHGIQYYASRAGDPVYWLKYAERYGALTAADVSRAVANQLKPDQRTVLAIRLDAAAPKIGRVPGARADAPAAARPSPARAESTETAGPAAAAAPETPPEMTIPFIDRQGSFDIPLPLELVLPEGFRAQLFERHEVPIVRVSVVIRWQRPFVGLEAGRLMESLLLASRAPKANQNLESELRLIGAHLSWDTTLDATTLTFSAPPDRLSLALERTMAVLRSRRISAAELDRVRNVNLAIAPTLTAQGKAFLWLRHLFVPNTHRYSAAVDNGVAWLKKLTAPEVERYLDREIRGAAVTIDIVGDVTPTRLASLLGARRVDRVSRASYKPIEWGKGTFLVQQNGAKGAELIIAIPRPSWGSAEYPAETAIERQLFDRVNEDLSAHGLNTWSELRARSWELRDGSLAYFAVHVAKDKLEPFVKTVVDRLELLRNSDKVAPHLAAVRSNDVFWLSRGYDSTRDAIGRLNFYATFDLNPRTLLDYRKGCEELTFDQVRDVANKYFKPDQLRILAIGDVASSENALKRLPIGPVTVLSEDSGGSP
jgi:zinc protease